MIIDFIQDNWPGILTGMITGTLTGLLVATLIYVLRGARKVIAYRQFKKYEGTYNSYRKEDKERSKPITTIEISVKKNRLTVNGKRISDRSKIYGNIEMNLSMPDYGRGYYRHIDKDG